MEGLVPLLLTAGISGGFLYASKRKEGFTVVDPPVQQATGDKFTFSVEAGNNKFNPVVNLIDPVSNPYFPKGSTQGQILAQDQKVKQALMSATANPMSESLQLKPSDTATLDITQLKGTNTLDDIRICEKIRTSGCGAFNDPKFAAACGICHEQGRDSGGNPTLGGLYVLRDDIQNTRESTVRMGSRRANYVPSVGQCAPGKFSVNKAQCQRIEKQLECEKKQNFDVDGCSQCFQDEKFQFLDTEVDPTYPHLVVGGQGRLTYTVVDTSNKTNTVTKELSATPIVIELPKFKEGDIVELQITGEGARIGGYLEGKTASGNFTLDIIRLIQSDLESGAKPRITGFQTLNGNDISLIRPATGKTTMRLPVRNVFTFIESDQVEAGYCASAPYIRKASSAEFLNSGPCYKKGQAPGKYSLECLQGIFTNAGCTTSGEGYPGDQTKANALMRGPGGRLQTIPQIAGKVYTIQQESFSGQRGGKKMTIPQWDEVSRFCTGKAINNPCDTDNKVSGPLSADCLAYLWENKGATDSKPGALGATYSGNTQRYCNSEGLMAPINSKGQYNQVAIAAAQKVGGVDAVKAMYNRIHAVANDNTQPDQARKMALDQCYGIELRPLPDATLPGSPSEPTSSCVPQTIIPQLVGGTPSKVYATLNFKQSWNLTMSMQPTGNPGGPSFDNILLFTGNRRDEPQFGARVLGLWFFPYSNRLHVSGSTDKNTFWSINTDGQLPRDRVTNVSISCNANKITLKCTGGLNEERTQDFPTTMYNGQVELFAPGPAHPSFKGTMTNLSFCTFTSNLTSVLDSRPGRTKSTLMRNNYNPMDWSRFSKPVAVLGPYGRNPWGTWWASGFPTNSGAQWIWTNVGAINNEPSWDNRQFFYRYTNSTNNMINITLIVAADNVASILINDANVANSSGNVTRVNVSFPPGENKIQINAANRGGPAGLCVAAMANNQYVFVSDGRWTTT